MLLVDWQCWKCHYYWRNAWKSLSSPFRTQHNFSLLSFWSTLRSKSDERCHLIAWGLFASVELLTLKFKSHLISTLCSGNANLICQARCYLLEWSYYTSCEVHSMKVYPLRSPPVSYFNAIHFFDLRGQHAFYHWTITERLSFLSSLIRFCNFRSLLLHPQIILPLYDQLPMT